MSLSSGEYRVRLGYRGGLLECHLTARVSGGVIVSARREWNDGQRVVDTELVTPTPALADALERECAESTRLGSLVTAVEFKPDVWVGETRLPATPHLPPHAPDMDSVHGGRA